MRRPHSLQRRLGLWLGLLLAMLWVGAATVGVILSHRAMDQAFDSALQEAAQRILPLAVADSVGREQEGVTQRLAEIRAHDELITYLVRDARGRILLLSHDADPDAFPPWAGAGFGQSKTHRFYSEETLRGSVRLTMAEPLAHRKAALRKIQIGLGIPLLVFLPLSLLAIVLTVRTTLAPLRRFSARLASREASDLSRLPNDGLPAEVAPLAEALNDLLERLGAAFQAERNFAANAAHEFRTPLAGAIAQAQRLRTETRDPVTRERASGIETTLKRLTRLSERLMQLARAEGGQLRLERAADLRPVARILADELARTAAPGRIILSLPEAPLMSDLDPDAFAILFRNLVENALRHGVEDAPIDVSLTSEGLLTVGNEGPIVPSEDLARLTSRFERAGRLGDGSGLGLAIVDAIAQRTGTMLDLKSPRTGRDSGFEAHLMLPMAGARAASSG